MMTPIQMMMARSRDKARRLKDDESGVIVAFGVFFILTMLLVGGVGIDLMRFEYTRSSLQGTLDRAVLAAADLDQKDDPTDVVEDYFHKTNLDQYLKSVTVDQGLNYREVSATAEFSMPTQYMRMMGVDTLLAPAAGTAAESVDGVEISLVLDMSGSMGSNSKLDNLQDAAKDFVRKMINSSPPGDVAVSIIPYATQVNAGPKLAKHFNLSGEHDFSHCVNFDSTDFDSTTISTTAQLKQTGPFDPWYEVEEELRLPVCPEREASEIMPYSGNISDMEDYIDDFTADGNTSIDIGVKWGAALLDPAMRPVVDQMITDGDVSSSFTGMPSNFNDDTLKVMVVMTDGQNTAQYYLGDNYRSGLTDVYYYEGDADGDGDTDRVYSVKSGSTYYYERVQGSGGSGCYDYYYYYGRKYCTFPSNGSKPFEGGSSVRLDFPSLFHQASNEWIADNLYRDIWGRSYSSYYWESLAYSYVSGSTKDSRLDKICTAAKNAGIIIYTIGFEAPSSGEAVLESCASSDAHFFDVDGLEISDAFVSIASSISKLRLIQ